MQGWYWFLGISSKQQHMLQDPTKVNEHLQTTNKKISKRWIKPISFSSIWQILIVYPNQQNKKS